MLPQLANVAVGIWLMAAPAVLGYGEPAATNERIFGPSAAAIAFIALWEVTRPVRWTNVAIGAWLLLAPFVLGYSTPPLINSMAAAVLLIVFSTRGGRDPERFGGGWSSLLRRER